jgi:hypothetical protein
MMCNVAFNRSGCIWNHNLMIELEDLFGAALGKGTQSAKM